MDTWLFENDESSVSLEPERRKAQGSYYTPDAVVSSLVRWVVRNPADRMLDPACGDGRFLVVHPNSVGVEQDPQASALVHVRAPGCLIHEGDFFAWAARTQERFECAAGNPPFIRYQRFAGSTRKAALELCARHGASFTSLCSSWAPFLVATATLLKPGGRMAFVVPAEIGHAPYAAPVLSYLTRRFDRVQAIAIQEKLFPDLSEDCWLLYCDGFGGHTGSIAMSLLERFAGSASPPRQATSVDVNEWRQWNSRLRPFLLASELRDLYRQVAESKHSARLSDIARVGIGYVTGANEFFHLRPSDARRRAIPHDFLYPAVRNGRSLAGGAITPATVDAWRRRDDPMLLLRIKAGDDLPTSVREYLDSPAGQEARHGYKCRNRKPWYVVPDVTIPNAFLSYMSGDTPALVANRAKCVATNSVHVVHLKGKTALAELHGLWDQPLTRLSCEIEGHPLGGGMLKLEPREAGRIVLGHAVLRSRHEQSLVAGGIETMRRWRHYG